MKKPACSVWSVEHRLGSRLTPLVRLPCLLNQNCQAISSGGSGFPGRGFQTVRRQAGSLMGIGKLTVVFTSPWSPTIQETHVVLLSAQQRICHTENPSGHSIESIQGPEHNMWSDFHVREGHRLPIPRGQAYHSRSAVGHALLTAQSMSKGCKTAVASAPLSHRHARPWHPPHARYSRPKALLSRCRK